MRNPPSIALSKVTNARTALTVIALARAALWAGIAFVVVLVIAKLVSLTPAQSHIYRMGEWSGALAIAAAMTTFCISIWRERFAWSRRRVALWIEERVPHLKYALVTLTDPCYADVALPLALDAAVSQIRLHSFLWARALRALIAPTLIFAVAIVALALLPDGRRSTSIGTGPVASAAVPVLNRLLNLAATLTPPAYAGRPNETLSDFNTIEGLVGTEVVLTGHGLAAGIGAKLGEVDIPVAGVGSAASTEGAGWRISFVLPQTAMALILTDRNYRRIVVLNPRPDEAPTVKLRQPASDTILVAVSGSLTLEADLQDDIGLAEAHFEYIVSSGEGEGNITSRAGTLGERRFDRNVLTAQLQNAVPYAWFKLKEGDQLSVRAVAVDGNTLSGPGKGYSEARIIRVAKKNERIDVNVNPAPPPFDASVMSLRMLIVATEKLDKRRSTMAHPEYVKAAEPLASQADGIRQKIQGFVDDRSQGGSFAVDPLLTAALAAMWDASRSLGIAETGEALPPLRKAYGALSKLSKASKYYFRGQPPPAMVDVARIRMSGTERVAPSPRMAHPEDRDQTEHLAARFAQAVQRLKADRTGAVEQLTLLRVAALHDFPPLASALQKVITALEAGHDPSASLVEARQALEGRPRAYPTLPAWSPLP
jgi:hypothetical protein